MAILVTGGAGYIGSHIVAQLLEDREEVILIDNLQKGHIQAVVTGALFYKGDLRDRKFLNQVFQENKIEVVVHLAGDSSVAESVEDPLKYYDNNVFGAICLLQVMKKYGVKKIVFSSTAATYGELTKIPILENNLTRPTNPYGETKLAIEKMLKYSEQAYGIKHIILRYFNVTGADLIHDIGEDHQPETHLIPLILQVALGKREKILVFGNDYDTADGTCIRDYIHVSDLATAHTLGIKQLRERNESEIYNLGNGNGFTVNEVIKAASKVTGKVIPTEVVPRRIGDPTKLVASSEKARNKLGWKPHFTSLEKMVESAWNWYVRHPNGYEKGKKHH